MSLIEAARKFDEADNPVEAIHAFESAIRNFEANREDFLDLALLYFSCCDFGYASFHQLPRDIEESAFEKSLETLDSAEKAFGPNTETAFWKRLIRSQVLYEKFEMKDLLPLLNENDSLVPFYYAFIASSGKSYSSEAKRLFEKVSGKKSARQRFIAGILEKRIRA